MVLGLLEDIDGITNVLDLSLTNVFLLDYFDGDLLSRFFVDALADNRPRLAICYKLLNDLITNNDLLLNLMGDIGMVISNLNIVIIELIEYINGAQLLYLLGSTLNIGCVIIHASD